MKVTVRGWARDMGAKELAEFDLSDLRISRDGTAYRNTPVMYSRLGRVTVSWCQPMRYMGDYRMDLDFTADDVLKLFKANFGSELGASLIEEHDFTLSPELVKSILKSVKLSDLTLGDLAAMQAARVEAEEEQADKPAETQNVRPFLRRIRL